MSRSVALAAFLAHVEVVHHLASAHRGEAVPDAAFKSVEVLQSGRQHVASSKRARQASSLELVSEHGDDWESSLMEGNWSFPKWSRRSTTATPIKPGSSWMQPATLTGLREALGVLESADGSGCDLDVTGSLALGEEDGIVRVTDLRGCYPHLADACPDLAGLKEQLEGLEGKVAAPLLAPNFEHEYVVKKVPTKEVLGLRSSLLKLYAETSQELKVRKVQTLVTPMCLLVTMSHLPAGEGRLSKAAAAVKNKLYEPETWAVMRRVRLTEGDATELGVVPEAAHMFQMSGQVPFAALKSMASSAKRWVKGALKMEPSKVKASDEGFKELFPMGLEIMRTDQCRSCVDLQETLKSDSAMLESLQMTGYKLFVQVYKAETEEDSTASGGPCGAKGRFPAVYKARDPMTKQIFAVTLGIVGYGTTDVANPLLVLSTRLKPGKYRNHFEKLFGDKVQKGYFTCFHSDFTYD